MLNWLLVKMHSEILKIRETLQPDLKNRNLTESNCHFDKAAIPVSLQKKTNHGFFVLFP